MEDELTHHNVIKRLVNAMNHLRAAVNAADVHASIAAGANISSALDRASDAEVFYTAWLLSKRK